MTEDWEATLEEVLALKDQPGPVTVLRNLRVPPSHHARDFQDAIAHAFDAVVLMLTQDDGGLCLIIQHRLPSITCTPCSTGQHDEHEEQSLAEAVGSSIFIIRCQCGPCTARSSGNGGVPPSDDLDERQPLPGEEPA